MTRFKLSDEDVVLLCRAVFKEVHNQVRNSCNGHGVLVCDYVTVVNVCVSTL